MISLNQELPYSFCKRHGVIAEMSPASGSLKLTLKNGASANAISEVQRLLGMIDEIEFESDIEFNRLLSQHFEGNRETSFDEAEKIGGELNLDDVARELAEPEDLLESDDDAPIIRLINALIRRMIGASSSLSSRSSGSASSRATSSRLSSPPIFSASSNEVSRLPSKCWLSRRLNSISDSNSISSIIPSNR